MFTTYNVDYLQSNTSNNNATSPKTIEYTHLYAGDFPVERPNPLGFIGLSLSQQNSRHIRHDITKPHDMIPNNSVEIYQAEDVFEHIPYEIIPSIISDIYRMLKPGGLFRTSVPDYRCNILSGRSMKTKDGEIYFDPGGGGKWDATTNRVVDGGHVWFPVIETVRNLLEKSPFNADNVNCLHYIDKNGNNVMKNVDYSQGFINRTPDHDPRVSNPPRVMSIVVDCVK